MKYIKPFNESIGKNSRGIVNDFRSKSRTTDEILKNKLVRRTALKRTDIIVDKLIEEIKKEDKNEGLIKGLMWVLGIDDNKHVWIEGNDLKITR